MNQSSMKIIKSEVEGLKYIYSLITKEQKANAEPFPNIPFPLPVTDPAKNDRIDKKIAAFYM